MDVTRHIGAYVQGDKDYNTPLVTLCVTDLCSCDYYCEYLLYFLSDFNLYSDKDSASSTSSLFTNLFTTTTSLF